MLSSLSHQALPVIPPIGARGADERRRDEGSGSSESNSLLYVVAFSPWMEVFNFSSMITLLIRWRWREGSVRSWED